MFKYILFAALATLAIVNAHEGTLMHQEPLVQTSHDDDHDDHGHGSGAGQCGILAFFWIPVAIPITMIILSIHTVEAFVELFDQETAHAMHEVCEWLDAVKDFC